MGILESIGVYVGLSEFIMNIIAASVIFIVGIALGIIVHHILRKGLDNAKIEKAKGYSFLKRFIRIIEWSIYILFLSLALKILGIPRVTDWLAAILIVLPALVGALLLISVGFAIANYLKDSVDESQLRGKESLANVFYYFVLYVFLAFALKTALISFDSTISNIIIVVLTGVVAIGVMLHKVLMFRKK